MAVTFKVNGRDLTAYLRLQHEEGFDPVGAEYLEPQFAGSTALREGQMWAGDATHNREWTVPLFLSATSEDALHQLISDINAELFPGAEVEFRSSGATRSSFFRLHRGRLDVEYQFWITTHNRVRATLHLWSDPFAGTGTIRHIVNAPTPQRAVRTYDATGVLGDAEALGALEVTVGSWVASNGRLIAYGVHDSASYNPFFGPSDARLEPQASSVVSANASAVASQQLAIPVSPTGASGVALRAYLTPPGGHTGRHRVFGIFQSQLDQPITMYARNRDGSPIGPTTAASQIDSSRWGLVDLGEINVPARASGQEPVPTQVVDIVAGGAAGAGINGSPALRTQGLVLLPLERSAGLMLTKGARGGEILRDSFDDLGFGNLLLREPWEHKSAAWLMGPRPNDRGYVTPGYGVNASGVAIPNSGATALYRANGAEQSDVLVSGGFMLIGGSGIASGAVVDFWAKADANASAGVFARVVAGPSSARSFAIMHYTGSGATARASVAMHSALALVMHLSGELRVELAVKGQNATAVLKSPAAPTTQTISVSHAGLTMAGAPAMLAHNGRATQTVHQMEGVWLTEVQAQTLGATAPDITPQEMFVIESYPQARAFQGNASVFKHDRAADFRGDHPRIPPVGSPGASGPAKLVAFSGDPENFRGHDGFGLRLTVAERFRYLR